MITVEPEGKGRKHSYLPRALAAVFATVRDCPRPDAQDLERAVYLC